MWHSSRTSLFHCSTPSHPCDTPSPQLRPRRLLIATQSAARRGHGTDIGIGSCRATLGRFWQALENPALSEGEFALKVGLPADSGGSEHIWANRIERRD